jgi:uncharacterized membrane protein
VSVADERSDQRVEVMLGNLLRFGVLLSAVVTAVGGGVYLIRHGSEKADYSKFNNEGAEPDLRSPAKVITGVGSGSGRALVQFGLLLLIATPVTRVAVSAYAFARQRDWAYVAMTLFVLVVLLIGLFNGGG